MPNYVRVQWPASAGERTAYKAVANSTFSSPLRLLQESGGEKEDFAFIATVREGFNTTYIGPLDFVGFNINEILMNMESYLRNPGLYVAHTLASLLAR